MLTDSSKFQEFLTMTNTTKQELADMEPKHSASYYSAILKGKKDPSTKMRFEIMHKTHGYVMPWDWFNMEAIPKQFLVQSRLFYSNRAELSSKIG